MANLHWQHLNKLKIILNAFEDSEITAYQFLHGLLSTNIFEDRPVTLSLVEDLDAILDTVKSAEATSDQTNQWVFRSAEKGYQAQVLQLTKKESGLLMFYYLILYFLFIFFFVIIRPSVSAERLRLLSDSHSFTFFTVTSYAHLVFACL